MTLLLFIRFLSNKPFLFTSCITIILLPFASKISVITINLSGTLPLFSEIGFIIIIGSSDFSKTSITFSFPRL